MRQVAKPMLVGLVIGLSFLASVRLGMVVKFGLNDDSALFTILQSTLFWIPFYLGLAIPMSLFCGLMIGFDKLAKSSELIVLQACGQGPLRLIRPAALLTTLTIVLGTFIYGWVEPFTTYARRAFNHEIELRAVYLAVEQQAFIKLGSTVIFVDEIDRKNGLLKRIFIHRKLRGDRIQTLTGQQGRLILSSHTKQPTLELHDAQIFDVTHSLDRSKEGRQPSFRVSQTIMLRTLLGGSYKPFRARGRSPKEWALTELIFTDHVGPQQANNRKVFIELNFRFAKILFIAILPFLALTFSNLYNNRRATYRLGFGIITLFVGHELLVYGAFIANSHAMPPLLVIWFPLLVLAAAAVGRSYRMLYRPGGGL
ncbi:MAG: YjgP/YjgQ family permease [Alphaproteobacteria bacterium]|nr:YjgP/YjgQ family permease [Alphaproteobacteria bacterium]